MRKVMQDITLSDGTYLPKGTMIVAASLGTHTDEKYYKSAEAFEPFKFLRCARRAMQSASSA